MTVMAKPAKAKGAQRVIEVLDFFDEHHREATVMDIARRYNRPQSSTSELLASLVDLGLLYKDPSSRSYTLTPRAAIIGSLSQPSMVRDGRLARMVDELRGQTGLGVVLIGMIGTQAHIFRWNCGIKRLALVAEGGGFAGGAQESLSDTAAGWLLLSTLNPSRRDGLLRRLNAEAPEHRKFAPTEMSMRVRNCAEQGFSVGPAGFGVSATLASVLLPASQTDRPMAIGFVCQNGDEVDPAVLVALLQRAIERATGAPGSPDSVSNIANAA